MTVVKLDTMTEKRKKLVELLKENKDVMLVAYWNLETWRRIQISNEHGELPEEKVEKMLSELPEITHDSFLVVLKGNDFIDSLKESVLNEKFSKNLIPKTARFGYTNYKFLFRSTAQNGMRRPDIPDKCYEVLHVNPVWEFYEHIEKDDVDSVRTMIEGGFDPCTPHPRDRIRPLHHAARLVCSEKSLKFFLELGFNPNEKDEAFGFEPLWYAANQRAFSNMEILVEHGANLNVKRENGWTLLAEGIQSKNTSMIDFLKKYRHLLNQENQTNLEIFESGIEPFNIKDMFSKQKFLPIL